MSCLKLGVKTLVLDETERGLLSKRGDLKRWTLPGGRVDSGESMIDAAIREVEEETGIVAEIDRPLGLIYWQGWNRVNVLFGGYALGGSLHSHTDESLDNRFFAYRVLPDNNLDIQHIEEALTSPYPILNVVTSSKQTLWQLRVRFGVRWIQNFLSGRPEPKYPRFQTQAVVILTDEWGKRVVTVKEGKIRSLPRIQCDGQSAPWEQLAEVIKQKYGASITLRWAGVWQNPDQNIVEFVFRASVEQLALTPDAEWSTIQNIPLMQKDAEYITHTIQNNQFAPVWMIIERSAYMNMISHNG
jgi:8-oxo-dGTP pyrophosphatase MutT (NUDIX family)